MDVRPRLTPLAASEQTNWTTPPSCAYTPPHTHTHRDLPRHVPSPMAYASPVCTPAPNTGGLPPGNEPISRLHCQALRHSPPPDTSTKLCCGVPKEPQPDDDGRNLAPVGCPSRRSTKGRGTDRAVPATGSTDNVFDGNDGELFRCEVMHGRTGMEPAQQARGDRSSQRRGASVSGCLPVNTRGLGWVQARAYPPQHDQELCQHVDSTVRAGLLPHRGYPSPAFLSWKGR